MSERKANEVCVTCVVSGHFKVVPVAFKHLIIVLLIGINTQLLPPKSHHKDKE